MAQKIIQIGNSAGIIIPKATLKKNNLRVGSKVKLHDTEEGKVVISKQVKRAANVIDKEVYDVAKKLLDRYGPAFEELAKK